jgi:ATP-binding cassette subfamily B protein
MNSNFLVLDDSLSAVDAETEQRLLEGIASLRKSAAGSKSVIIISHRVSTLRYADRILVLENGELAEYGTPAELTASNGFYSRMAALQRLEDTEDHHG